MPATKMMLQESQPSELRSAPSFAYLAYAKFCATSGVTGGPVEEINGIPVPAQLLEESLQSSKPQIVSVIPSPCQ